LIRSLSASITDKNRDTVKAQIANLQQRIRLIRTMQVLGVLSFLLCTASMVLIFFEEPMAGSWLFGISILVLSASLVYSMREIMISTRALEVILEHLEDR
jgi:hypothetical protein